MEENTLILMKNIFKSYKMGQNDVIALKDISIEIEKGEFAAILGPSGSGKTTLMNIIGCIDIPDSGEYILAGRNIKDRSEDALAIIRNKEIGFIFQSFNLLAKYTAIQNVELPLLLRGIPRATAHDKAVRALQRVGLEDRINHRPNELSGGQQQRVSIARALVGEAKILLADEPTGNLDSKSGQEIMDIFIELNNEGNTVILITHDMNIAEKAKRIINVKDGKVC